MQVQVKVLGIPAIPSSDQTIGLSQGTLAELVEHLNQLHPQALSRGQIVLAIVNGRAAARNWDSVALHEADRVVLIAPLSGG